MEQIIEKLIQNFEKGKLSRRQLIKSLSVATGAAISGVTAAEAAPLKTAGIDHISYRVADYAKTRDFYSGLLGLKVTNDVGTKCRLQVGGLAIVVQPGEDERTRRTPMIDHIAYSIDNTKAEILAELKRRGVTQQFGINHPPSGTAPPPTEGNGVQVLDPDGFHVTLSAKR